MFENKTYVCADKWVEHINQSLLRFGCECMSVPIMYRERYATCVGMLPVISEQDEDYGDYALVNRNDITLNSSLTATSDGCSLFRLHPYDKRLSAYN